MFVENKTTEFKREYVEDIKNTIVAFANFDGGTLYIGVNDDGIVCGVDDIDGTMLRVTNAIRLEMLCGQILLCLWNAVMMSWTKSCHIND